MTKSSPPLGVLVLLSIALPGAGQLAYGGKVRASIFIGASISLAIAFFFQLSELMAPFASALAAGADPMMDESFKNDVKILVMILLASALVWVAALVDVLVFGRRAASPGGGGGSEG